MSIKIRDLRNAVTTSPPFDTLLGGRVARKDRVLSAHAQADSLLGNDRNVVARVGLHGASAFQVPSTNPTSALQTHPLRTVSRYTARTPPFAVLPAHFLVLSALVVPSGMTQKVPLGGGFAADAAYGCIEVAVNWSGPGATTTTHSTAPLPTSGETWAAETTAAGASWAGLRRVEIPLMFPAAAGTSPADLRTWCEGVSAEVLVSYRGGVRAVDVVVQQVPFKYARNVGVDTTYSSTLVTTGAGEIVPGYPVDYPIEERNASDPTFGSLLLADVADRQHHAIGPVLAHWTAFCESTTPVTATAVPMVSTTSTTFVDMLQSSMTAWDSAQPGWSLSSGGHALQFKSSGGYREMRDRNTCIPVRCWALCSRAVSGTATLRFQSENYSIAELNFSSSAHAWRSCTGHLRAGIAAEDASVLEVFGKAAASSTLNLSSVLIEYRDL